MYRIALACLAAALAAAGCERGDASDRIVPTPTSPATPSPNSTPQALASGIDLTRVSITQGVDIVLMDADAPVTRIQSPIVAGRDALLRMFVAPHEGAEPQEIEATVVITDGDTPTRLTTSGTISRASAQDDLASTLNVDIPGALLVRDATIEVELKEPRADARREGTGAVSWHSDETGGLAIEEIDQLDIVVIPVAYHADGSGRMPDTSEARLQAIHDRMFGRYPAPRVTVTVGETLDWYGHIDAFSGWDDLLLEVNALRDGAQVPPNTYYYAMFQPTDTLAAFCSSGCILGLSFVATSANDPFFRASIGVGYPGDEAVEAVPHEIGHAHGRWHAPCGLYGQAFDTNYPHENASLGTWGYDLVEGNLVDPSESSDMMSYCTPSWVSDYTYFHLRARMRDVSRGNRSGASTWRAMRLGPDGQVVPGPTVRLATPGGDALDVELRDGAGGSLGLATGWFVPFDHLDGGIVFVPDLPDLHTIDLR